MLATQRTDREGIYVAMTRCRETNHLHFVAAEPQNCGATPHPTDQRQTLLAALTRHEQGSATGQLTPPCTHAHQLTFPTNAPLDLHQPHEL